MPQLGETVTEGTITKWFKSVGDTVARDEPLFEVSTDKVDSEVPSPAEGVLTAILVEEGDTVDVGVALAVIDAGASASSVAAAPQAEAPAVGTDAAPLAGLPDEPVAVATASAPAVPAEPATPAQGVVAATATAPKTPAPDGNGTGASGGTGDRDSAGDRDGTGDSDSAGDRDGTGRSMVLSPVVRRLLHDHDIEPSSVRGTGLGGRITRSDVEALIERGAPASVPSIPADVTNGARAGLAAGPVGAVGSAAAGPAGVVRRPDTATGDRDEIVPFTNIRRRTAEHMTRSKATSAHTLMVKEIDYERVEQVRRAHGERFRQEEGFGLTYLPFVARASVEALADFPHLNASVGEDALVVHHDINLGIAVDLDNEGLIVPVVHRAEELNLRGMARRIRDVADRARTKRLSLDDISGGTFSITNAGPFGTLITGAIINQPQVAILSTDGVSRKPVVIEQPDGSETIGIHSIGLVAMNFDHRAVDGAYVARFLARLSDILDGRDWAGEL